MRILGIIPARYQSTRLPGKPLLKIRGKTIIHRVYERASASDISKLAVATDNQRIVDEVLSFGGVALMTGADHQSGTDRCHEALGKIGGEWDMVINIQGDEPFFEPEHIQLLIPLFKEKKTLIGTLCTPIKDERSLHDPNTPKVVFDKFGKAIYFSRHPIPYNRNAGHDKWLSSLSIYYKHIGIYAFRPEVLKEVSLLSQSSLEKTEMLEQLRWPENGYEIRVATTQKDTLTIDTKEDYLNALKVYPE